MEKLPQKILAASSRIKAVSGGVRETPLEYSGVFSDRTGAEVYLKSEHLQRTGSFKMRGAMNKVLSLSEEDKNRGIVTASSGNHGMATTQAAKVAGLEVTVYLPENVSALKHANMTRMGAKTVLVPGHGVEAEVAGRLAAEQTGRVFVSPYSDPDVIIGQGSIGVELVEQFPDLAAVYICVGGGGLIAGVGSYLKDACPGVQVIGCWAENAAAMHHCLERGEIYDAPESETLSDGSAGGVEPGAITFPLCQDVIDRHVLVSEAEVAAAMRDMAASENFIIEGAAGVALAAALKTAGDYKGKKIAVVICGRNVTLDTFQSALEMAE